MLLVGVIFLVLQKSTGHYYVEGVGYATIQDILTGSLGGAAFLALLFALKLLTTGLTLGSGGSGGIFSPSLFMGAALGCSYGIVLHQLFPAFDISPTAFAVAGMAGVVGGVTGAALTAIVMIMEMTLDYNVVLPITITVAMSYGIRRLMCRESIYTLKLVRRGHYIPEALHSNVHSLKRAKNLLDPRFTVVPDRVPAAEFRNLLARTPDTLWYLFGSSGLIAGVLSRERAFAVVSALDDAAVVAEAAPRAWITIREDVPLYGILAHLRLANADIALVMGDDSDSIGEVRGVIGSEQIVAALEESVELFPG